MGKKSSKAPKVPDPVRILEKESELNRINQYSPYGNVIYGEDGDGRQNVTRGLSPDLQNLFSQAVSIAQGGGGQGYGGYDGRISHGPATPTLASFQPVQLQNTPQAPQIPGMSQGQQAPQLNQNVIQAPELQYYNSNPAQISQDLINKNYVPTSFGTDNEYTRKTFEQAKSLLAPEFEDRERALLQRLANQGLPTAGEAYNRTTGNFEEERNNALTRAAFQAIQAGDQRYNTQFAQEQQALAQAQQAALAQQQFDEAGRQNNNAANFQLAGFNEGQRQFDENQILQRINFDENQRKFNESNILQRGNFLEGQRQFAASDLLNRANFLEGQRRYDQGFETQRDQQLFNMASAILGLQPTPQTANLNVQGAYNAAQQQANLNAQAKAQQQANTFKAIGQTIGLVAAPFTGGASLATAFL